MLSEEYKAQEVAGRWINGDPGVGKFLELRVQEYTGHDLSMNPADYVAGGQTMIPLPIDRNDPELANAPRHTFEFVRSQGGSETPWKIRVDGGDKFPMDPRRISALLGGETEIWSIKGNSSWTHPVHIHFEEGVILSRGGKAPPEWEKWARKDLYRVGPEEDSTDTVEVAIRARDFVGSFVEHCHNTMHEDHAMLMRWDALHPDQLEMAQTPMPDWDGVRFETSFTLAASEDTTPPVITILGQNPVEVLQGSDYVDAGATAMDNKDGAVVVVTTGNVDTETLGTYTLTYTATDAAGNSASKTRTVDVVESLLLASSVTRSFSTLTPDSCSDLTVRLSVDVVPGDTFYIIDEILPAGWVISNAGSGNTQELGHIKWAVLAGAVSTVNEYTVSVPCTASGPAIFSGEYGFNAGLSPIKGQTNVDVKADNDNTASTISGLVFQDTDSDQVKDVGEPGLSGWTIFLDENDNTILDGGETSVFTDINGNYQFTDVAGGTQNVREVLQTGWLQTAPADGKYTVEVTSNNSFTNQDFGNTPSSPNPTSTPTPTPTSTPSSSTTNSSSSGNGNSVAGASAPVCSDVKPGSAPILSGKVTGSNEVTLSWTKAKDPVTFYLVAFGLSSGDIRFGNPNVGDKNTTSTVIKGLSGGTTYFFRVRGGNGCMPGAFSNEISLTPGGTRISQEVPEGFSEDV
ncbi:MAG: DUF5011 domain-containing protein, partial [Elusimicrobia bacterium]|nr:DUF5011 domain-containing protein [Elusimicrobiota bacterium]